MILNRFFLILVVFFHLLSCRLDDEALSNWVPDGELRACLKAEGVENLEDLKKLEELGCHDVYHHFKIRSLEGLQYAESLIRLTFWFEMPGNSTHELLSLAPLYGLNNLEEIDLGGYREGRITIDHRQIDFKVLEGVKNLKKLALTGYGHTQLLNLSYASSLETLVIGGCLYALDFNPAGHLEDRIYWIYDIVTPEYNCMARSHIIGVQSLGGLNRLKHLYISSESQLESLKGVEDLPSLKELVVRSHVGIKNIQALEGLLSIEELEISVDRYSLDDVSIDNHQILLSLLNLKKLDLNDVFFGSYNEFSAQQDLNYLYDRQKYD